MNEVQIFINRMKRIGIELELEGNAPWIYLKSVNGNKIHPEDWINANHGYTIAWYPLTIQKDFTLNWHDIKLTFKLIRKYAKIASHNREKTD